MGIEFNSIKKEANRLKSEIERSNGIFEQRMTKYSLNRSERILTFARTFVIGVLILILSVCLTFLIVWKLGEYYGSLGFALSGLVAGLISVISGIFIGSKFAKTLLSEGQTESDIEQIRRTEKPIYDDIQEYITSVIK